MPLIPLHGHDALRARLASQAATGALPSSLLFHGAAGVGKQRLAIWLGQVLLCTGATKPCGECDQCRFSGTWKHPDLRWFFPIPRKELGDDPEPEQVRGVYDEFIQERVEANGLYARPDGSAGIYRDVTRTIVQMASRSPALAKRKVFVVGDAERMVPQAANPEAANAFLKLLEEPPSDTTLILTSSEPGQLLPTIRSRVVAVRVAPLPEGAMRAFIEDPLALRALPNERPAELLRLANGAPGSLLAGTERTTSLTRARQLLAAADQGREQALRAAFTAGSGKARGAFSDVLDALTLLVRDRAQEAAGRGDSEGALRATRAIPAIEEAKLAASGNANPQLVTAHLLEVLRGGRT